MATMTTAAALAVALLILPALILWRLSLTPRQNARRMRRAGHSYRTIGRRVGRAPSTVYRWCHP